MESLPLPAGLTSRYIRSAASTLCYHVIEAGSKGQPLILLLHGFPELAFSWRRVMPGLAAAGYHVVAFDQRGYGRTTGWDESPYEQVDLSSYSPSTLIRDVVVLVYALGYSSVHCIVGHDFGAVAASLCALARPDLFHRVVLMSHPFKGAPKLPLGVDSQTKIDQEHREDHKEDIHLALAQLPEPRKHYKWYYSTAEAASDMDQPDGLADFLRGYFYLKSASWPGNKPHPLKGWTATELAQMPYYYMMPLNLGMREAVRLQLSNTEPDISTWLPDHDLAIYTAEYARTGFQGGLNWYRVQTDPANLRDLDMFAGKKVEVPCLMLLGSKDWGSYQEPGVVEAMGDVCSKFQGAKMLHSGHWMQQEAPDAVVDEISAFCR